jgi:hypothetical protein
MFLISLVQLRSIFKIDLDSNKEFLPKRTNRYSQLGLLQAYFSCVSKFSPSASGHDENAGTATNQQQDRGKESNYKPLGPMGSHTEAAFLGFIAAQAIISRLLSYVQNQ